MSLLPDTPEIIDYQFTKILVLSPFPLSAHTSDTEEEKMDTLNVTYDVATNKSNENLYRLNLQVTISRDDAPEEKRIEVAISGFFVFSDEKSQKGQRDVMIRLQGCMTLYGIVRGQIGAMTALFPGGKQILPHLSMTDLVEYVEKSKNHLGIDELKSEPDALDNSVVNPES